MIEFLQYMVDDSKKLNIRSYFNGLKSHLQTLSQINLERHIRNSHNKLRVQAMKEDLNMIHFKTERTVSTASFDS